MDHRTIAADEFSRCLAIARERYGFDGRVSVEWGLRGLTAGQARFKLIGKRTDGIPLFAIMTVRLNETVAQAEGAGFKTTVAHELAHIVTNWRAWKAGRRLPRSHGLEWQSVQRAFGYEPVLCHSYASAKRVVERRTFEYKCPCGEPHPISIVRHRKIVQGKATYRCTRCKGRLTAV